MTNPYISFVCATEMKPNDERPTLLHAPHLKLEHAVPVLVIQHKQLLELLQLRMENMRVDQRCGSMRADQRCGTGVKGGSETLNEGVGQCGTVRASVDRLIHRLPPCNGHTISVLSAQQV